MKKFKVEVNKLGKRIAWKGMNLSSPCKFFIDEKDVAHVKVVMKQTGINTSEYVINEYKESTEAIKVANSEATKSSEALAKKTSEDVKDALKDSPKVETEMEPGVPQIGKLEVKKPEAKDTKDSKSKK